MGGAGGCDGWEGQVGVMDGTGGCDGWEGQVGVMDGTGGYGKWYIASAYPPYYCVWCVLFLRLSHMSICLSLSQ